MTEELLKPYHLNECSCGNISKCKVCRSKYHHNYSKKLTPKEREEARAYARLKYQYMEPEAKERLKERSRKNYAALPPEKKKYYIYLEKERARAKRKLQREQRENFQRTGIC